MRLWRWIIFEVAFALMPFLGNYGITRLYGGDITLDTLIGHGELLLVCAGIAAACMGELVSELRQSKSWYTTKICLTGLHAIYLCAASIAFGAIAAHSHDNNTATGSLVAHPKFVVVISIV